MPAASSAVDGGSEPGISGTGWEDGRVPTDVLALSASHPERILAADEVLFSEGDDSTNLIVLVEGELVIEAADLPLHRHGTGHVRRRGRSGRSTAAASRRASSAASVVGPFHQ